MRLILLASLLLTISTAWSQFEGEYGVGVMIGNPTGLNGKYWLPDNKAIDGGAAMSLGKNTDFSLHSDYLFHNDGALFFNDEHPLDLFYGIGGRIEFGDDIELGVRVPVGITHKFTAEKADIFAEIAPIIDLVGRQGLEVHFGVGARYYFK